MTCECGLVSNMLINLPNAYGRSKWVSILCLVGENSQFSFILENNFIFLFRFLFLKKEKSNFSNSYLRMLVRITKSLYSESGTHSLKIGVGVRGVRIGLVIREWIRVDYITYCKLNLSFISFNEIYFIINN
jgi:hypothetical protein